MMMSFLVLLFDNIRINVGNQIQSERPLGDGRTRPSRCLPAMGGLLGRHRVRCGGVRRRPGGRCHGLCLGA